MPMYPKRNLISNNLYPCILVFVSMKSESCSVVSNSCDPMDYTVCGILQARIQEWVAFPFSRGSPQPRDRTNPGLPHCRWILYQLSHKRSPRNTGVGSLSLLQWIFSTQGLNPGLPHCRQILYQLSHQGSPQLLQ